MPLTIGGYSPVSASVVKRIVKLVRHYSPIMPRDINIVFTTDRAIQRLNKEHRGQNKPTTILSFNLNESDTGINGSSTGELYISLAKVRQEAKNINQETTSHLKHLIIHGLLHLAGFTHDSDRRQSLMEQKEESLAKIITPQHSLDHVIN